MIFLKKRCELSAANPEIMIGTGRIREKYGNRYRSPLLFPVRYLFLNEISISSFADGGGNSHHLRTGLYEITTYLFLGLRFFLPFFIFLAWWPPLLFLVRFFF
jgi:hypothetical protein